MCDALAMLLFDHEKEKRKGSLKQSDCIPTSIYRPTRIGVPRRKVEAHGLCSLRAYRRVFVHIADIQGAAVGHVYPVLLHHICRVSRGDASLSGRPIWSEERPGVE